MMPRFATEKMPPIRALRGLAREDATDGVDAQDAKSEVANGIAAEEGRSRTHHAIPDRRLQTAVDVRAEPDHGDRSHDLEPHVADRGGHQQDHHVARSDVRPSGTAKPRTAPVVTGTRRLESTAAAAPTISLAMSPRAPNAVKRQISRIVTCSGSTGYSHVATLEAARRPMPDRSRFRPVFADRRCASADASRRPLGAARWLPRWPGKRALPPPTSRFPGRLGETESHWRCQNARGRSITNAL